MAAGVLASFANPLDAAERLVLEQMTSDLQYLLAENEVPDRIQLTLATMGYKNLQMLSLIADDRPGVRTFIQTSMLDHTEAGLWSTGRIHQVGGE